MTLLLQDERLRFTSGVLDSPWIPNASPTFNGSKTMVNFENINGGDSTKRSLFQYFDKEENGDDDFDGFFHQSGKKRRLTPDQVEFLEESFEIENKLEPKRKVQLAKELGLQPRQVAIWFQNRRARFKTKQLEKEYGSLKASYDKLKADYDNLLKEGESLKTEVNSMKGKMHIKEKGKETFESIKVHNSQTVQPQNLISNQVYDKLTNVAMVVGKHEEASSAKSDTLDSDSPTNYTQNHSLLEPAVSSHVFEPDQSDFSQGEDNNLSRSLLPPHYFAKPEASCYDDDPTASSCNFPFSVVDQDRHFYLWP